ncbi:unnamed protein product, partial [marine sediment metagenome]
MKKYKHLFRKLPSNYFGNKNSGNYRFYIPPDLAVSNAECHKANSADILRTYKNSNEISLYVSIPFCKARCIYCNYFLYPYREGSEKFLDNTIKELTLLNKKVGIFKKNITSLYFGGGTPSIISKESLSKLLSSIIKKLNLIEDCEITVEASPEGDVQEKIEIIKNHANRLSLGIESFDDNHLKFLNRRYNSQKAKEVIKIALEYFDNVNIDLMYGIPNQTINDWVHTIETAISLDVTGISTYRASAIGYGPIASLIVSHRTNAPLYFIYKENPKIFPDEKTSILMYLASKKLLEKAGYKETLVGFFIKPNIEEIKVYQQRWAQSIPLYGIGLGAYSYAPFGFIHNHDKINNYENNIKNNDLPIRFFKNFGQQENLIFKILGRLKSGKMFNYEEVPKDFVKYFNKLIDPQVSYGLIERQNKNINLTLLGRALVD